MGCEVIQVEDGASALLAIHGGAADAAILGSPLPVLDGFQAVSALRGDAKTHRFPVILLTSSDDATETARGCSLGADVCLPLENGEADALLAIRRLLHLDEPREAPVRFAPCVR